MAVVLYLGHAVLGALALLIRNGEPEARSKVIEALGWTGMALAALLFAAPGAGTEWRTTEMDADLAHLVGVSIGCAWLLIVVFEHTRRGGDWDGAVLVGVAATALALFAMNGWVVPALLFLSVGTGALAVLLRGARGAGGLRITLVAGTALFAGGLGGDAWGAQTWAMPDRLEGWPLWLVASGVVLVAGAFPGTAWTIAGAGSAVARLPLLAGLGFTMLVVVAPAGLPLAALGLLVVALACCVASVVRAVLDLRLVASWTIALMLALGFTAPRADVVIQAGFAAVLVTSAIALWPLSFGRGQIERGLLLAAVSVTAGFHAISAAAGVAFERATESEAVLESAPWAAIAALLPVALAGGVALGARVARRGEPEEYAIPGVLATWGLFAAGVLWAVFAPGASQTATLWLYLVAVVVGIGAARLAARRGGPAPATSGIPSEELTGTEPVFPARAETALARASWAIGAVTAAAVLALTFQGLRVGFL